MARAAKNTDRSARRLRISAQLLGLLAIPLAALLAVTGWGVVNGASRTGDATELQLRTDLAVATYDLVDELQVERATLVADSTSTAEQRGAVGAASGAVATAADAVGGDLADEATVAVLRVETLQTVSERELGGRVAFTAYSATIDDLLDLASAALEPGGAIDGAPAVTVDGLARSQAASAQELDLVRILQSEDQLDAQSFQQLMSLASAQRSFAESAAATAPPALAVQIREVGFAMSAADSLRRDVFTDLERSGFDAWAQGLERRTAQVTELQTVAEQLAVDAVNDLARSSRVLFVVAALAAVAIALVSILLLRRAGRSIARPLQDLATQAEEVAHTRLPEAVRSQQHGNDELRLPALRATGAAEVRDVALAFNAVQDTALHLAGEQAALRVNQAEAMTNLGRRNQTLLGRQLDFISTLETRETDPTFLEHLFKLDHLASRMRRNAESLLILAGSETPRRRRTPAPVSEIVRASMSEVEDFERVRIGHLVGATLAGPVVIDIVHLMAELLENALNFSPPDSTVEIDGRPLGQGGYQFAVIDHGVGMSDVELTAANHRIRGLDELDGMPTRYLGQYVVAKLAAKTDTVVRLQPSAGGRGVTALVILASTAMVGAPGRGSTASPLPGSVAAREQGPEPFAPGSAVRSETRFDPAAPIDVTEARSARDLGSPAGWDTAGWDTADRDTADRADEVSAERATTGQWEWDIEATSSPESDEVRFVDESDAFDDAGVADEPAEPIDLHPTSDLQPTWLASQDDDPSAVAGPVPEVDPWAEFRDAAPLASEGAPLASEGAPLASEGAPLASDAAPLAAEAAPLDRPEVPAADPFRLEPSAAATPPPFTVSPNEPMPPAEPDEPPPPLPTRTPPTPVAQRPEPVSAESPAPEPATTGTGPNRTGGLSRRVPGATLADADPVGAAAPSTAADRSADGVRSMLSSFQAGRVRGRSPNAPAPEPGDVASSARDGMTPSDIQDGRSSQ